MEVLNEKTISIPLSPPLHPPNPIPGGRYPRLSDRGDEHWG